MLWRWLLTAIPGLLARANASLGMIVSDESSGIKSRIRAHFTFVRFSYNMGVGHRPRFILLCTMSRATLDQRASYARSPRMRRASWISLGMMVTRLA